MNVDFEILERDSLNSFLAHGSHLKSGLEKFLTAAAEANDKECSEAMRSIPRKPELAADHAAKAEALREVMSNLKRAVDKAYTSGTNPVVG